jgi:hypothetical protein
MASLCKMTVPYPGYRIVEEVYMKYERGLDCGFTPFCLYSDVTMRAGLVRTSAVKMHHFSTSLQHLRTAYLLDYPICLFPAHIFCRDGFIL